MKPEWMPPLPEFDLGSPQDIAKKMRNYALAAVEAYRKSLKPFGKYGCHCDLEDGQKPDDCVLNMNRPQDCVYALRLVREGKDQTSCEYWKKIDGGDDDAA